MLTTARTAFATYYLNEGTYAATDADLDAIEPALGDACELHRRAAPPRRGRPPRCRARARRSRSASTARNQYERDCDRPGQGLCRDPAGRQRQPLVAQSGAARSSSRSTTTASASVL